MPRRYDFVVANDHITADHRSDPAKTVSLAAQWLPDDDIEGDWEQVVRTLLSDAAGAIDQQSGALTLPRDRAVGILAAADGDLLADLARDEAAALVELLATEADIFRLEGASLIVFDTALAVEDISGITVLKWSLLLDACADTFRRVTDVIATVTTHFEAQMDPIDPDNDATADGSIPTDRLTQVTDTKEKLTSAAMALESKANEFRVQALETQTLPHGGDYIVNEVPAIFCEVAALLDGIDGHSPDDKLEMLNEFAVGDMATQLAGLGTIEDEIEDISVDDIDEIVADVVGGGDDTAAPSSEPSTADGADTETTAAADVAETSVDELDELVDEITDTVDAAVADSAATATQADDDEPATDAPGPGEPEPRVLTPIVKDDLPSSMVQVGQTRIGGDIPFVALRHKDTTAYFYADRIDDSVVDAIGSKIKMHRNVASLFGGIARDEEFVVDPTVSDGAVEDCQSVTISTDEIPHDELDAFLRAQTYLLHPMQEVLSMDAGLASFEVVEMEPAGHTTLRVTDATEIEFTGSSDDPS